MTYVTDPPCTICLDDYLAAGRSAPCSHHLNCEKCGRWICWDCTHEFGCGACKNDDRSGRVEEPPSPWEPQRAEIRYLPRTWRWWARWGLVVAVLYVTGSWMAFQFRYPELTQVQAFLSFWEAMTWQ